MIPLRSKDCPHGRCGRGPSPRSGPHLFSVMVWVPVSGGKVLPVATRDGGVVGTCCLRQDPRTSLTTPGLFRSYQDPSVSVTPPVALGLWAEECAGRSLRVSVVVGDKFLCFDGERTRSSPDPILLPSFSSGTSRRTSLGTLFSTLIKGIFFSFSGGNRLGSP